MTKRVNVALLEETREHLADICHKTQTYDELIEELITIAGPSVRKHKKIRSTTGQQSSKPEHTPQIEVIDK